MLEWRNDDAARPCAPPFIQHEVGTGRVVAGGALDFAVAPQLRDALRAAIAEPSKSVILNVRNVSLIDACVVGVLVDCQQTAAAAGRVIRLVGAERIVRRVLEITDTWRLFADDTAAVCRPINARHQRQRPHRRIVDEHGPR